MVTEPGNFVEPAALTTHVLDEWMRGGVPLRSLRQIARSARTASRLRCPRSGYRRIPAMHAPAARRASELPARCARAGRAGSASHCRPWLAGDIRSRTEEIAPPARAY